MTTTQKLIAMLVLAGLPLAASAGDKRYDVNLPAYKNECGSCHVAYPAPLLSAESWRAVMAGLGKHFGTDASIDAKAASEIEKFLVSQAGSGRKFTDTRTVLRISDRSWFKREHDEVPAATWKNPAVKSPANCGACHTQAEQGDYSERQIRIPQVRNPQVSISR